MSRILSFTISSIAVLSLGAGVATAENLVAHCKGDQEVPAVDTQGQC